MDRVWRWSYQNKKDLTLNQNSQTKIEEYVITKHKNNMIQIIKFRNFETKQNLSERGCLSNSNLY